LPIGAYFWLIHEYSVNVVYLDQWSDVGLLSHWYSGSLTFSDLWASHSDHRILFPNLIVIALAEFTRFNVVCEEYLSGVMLIAAAGLFIATHRRRAPSTPLIYYTPVTLLLFSFVQYQNTLWGFQMAWYLVTLALALALFLLDRPALTGWVFAGAIAAAIVGSFSSLQGLLIWPVGLLILCVRPRPRRSLVIWIACALITTTLYFHQLNSFEYSNQTYVFTHPIESLKFFLFLIGSILGVQSTNSPWPIIAFGAIVMVIAVWLVVKYQWRGERRSSLVGVSLICYGVLFAATITQGRAWFALWAPSRYATCGLLVLTGCYLAVLGRAPARNRRGSRGMTAEDRPGRRTVAGIVISIGLTGAICLQVIFGTGHGLASAKPWSQSQKETADIIVNLDNASDTLLQSQLHEGFTPSETRQLVQMMKANRLNVFGSGADSYYSRIGLLPRLTALQVKVVVPARGATIKGVALLGASAADLSGVTKVDFYVKSVDGGHDELIGAGRDSPYGWIASFNTTTYPNGGYELRSVAYGYGGKKSSSPSVGISVRNHP
jgi:Bacterial Ig domain